MGYVEQNIYDNSNRVTEVIDALKQKTAWHYDKGSRITEITDKLGRQRDLNTILTAISSL